MDSKKIKTFDPNFYSNLTSRFQVLNNNKLTIEIAIHDGNVLARNLLSMKVLIDSAVDQGKDQIIFQT